MQVPAHLAVGQAHAVGDRERLVRLDRLEHRFERRLAILRHDELDLVLETEPAPAVDAVARAELAGGEAHARLEAVGADVRVQDEARDRVGHQPQLLLGRAQLLLEPLALGDVADVRGDHHAARLLARERLVEVPADLAARDLHAVGDLQRREVLDRVPDRALGDVAVLRDDHVPELHEVLDVQLAVEAVGRQQAAGDELDLEREVLADHHLQHRAGDRFGEVAQPPLGRLGVLLGLGQVGLELHPIGDVGDVARHQRGAVRVAPQDGVVVVPAQRAVGQAHAVGHLPRRQRLHRGDHGLVHVLAVLLDDEVEQVVLARPLDVEAVARRHLARHEAPLAPGALPRLDRGMHDQSRDGVGHEAQQLLGRGRARFALAPVVDLEPQPPQPPQHQHAQQRDAGGGPGRPQHHAARVEPALDLDREPAVVDGLALGRADRGQALVEDRDELGRVLAHRHLHVALDAAVGRGRDLQVGQPELQDLVVQHGDVADRRVDLAGADRLQRFLGRVDQARVELRVARAHQVGLVVVPDQREALVEQRLDVRHERQVAARDHHRAEREVRLREQEQRLALGAAAGLQQHVDAARAQVVEGLVPGLAGHVLDAQVELALDQRHDVGGDAGRQAALVVEVDRLEGRVVADADCRASVEPGLLFRGQLRARASRQPGWQDCEQPPDRQEKSQQNRVPTPGRPPHGD